MPLYSHHISTILPVFNFAWDSHCGYLPECCWSLNRCDRGVFSISPVQIINQIFGIILIFDNDTTMKCIIEIGNNQRTSLEIFLLEKWARKEASDWNQGSMVGEIRWFWDLSGRRELAGRGYVVLGTVPSDEIKCQMSGVSCYVT